MVNNLSVPNCSVGFPPPQNICFFLTKRGEKKKKEFLLDIRHVIQESIG